MSSSSTDGGGGANLFGLLLNSVAAVSRTLAAESTLSTVQPQLQTVPILIQRIIQVILVLLHHFLQLRGV